MSSKKTHGIDDSDLFRQAIGAVQAIKQDKVALHAQRHPKPKPYPKPLAVHLENPLAANTADDLEKVGIHDSMRYLATGIQHNVLKKLRRGHFNIDAEIDLHGLNSHEAKRQLLHFLHNSIEEGYRCVHIVHGKGYRSPDNLPILKNELNYWLRQHKDVQAFCSASPKEGGSGALLVLLRLSDKYDIMSHFFDELDEL